MSAGSAITRLMTTRCAGRQWCILGVFAACVGCADAPDPEVMQQEQTVVLPRELIAATTIRLPNGDTADVYAPVVPRGLRRAFEDAFPVIVHLQGALVGRDSYQGFGRELARHGFVVVIPDHLRAFGPPGAPPVPFTEANVVGAATAAIATLDADPSSPLYLVADPHRVGIGGHSLGGVVALSLVNNQCTPPFCTPPFALPAEVGAVALYGTHFVQPAGVVDIDTHGVGVALLRGDLDGRAASDKIETTYAVLDDARALITIHGANHFGLCDTAAPAGAEPDPTAQTLDQETSVRAIATWAGRWFRDQLHGDPVAGLWLYGIGGSLDGSVTVDDSAP